MMFAQENQNIKKTKTQRMWQETIPLLQLLTMMLEMLVNRTLDIQFSKILYDNNLKIN